MSEHFEGLMHFMCHNDGGSDSKNLSFSLIFLYLLNMVAESVQEFITCCFY